MFIVYDFFTAVKYHDCHIIEKYSFTIALPIVCRYWYLKISLRRSMQNCGLSPSSAEIEQICKHPTPEYASMSSSTSLLTRSSLTSPGPSKELN